MRSRNDAISQAIAGSKLLKRAWRSVRAAGGAAGVDSETIEKFAADEARKLKALQQQLASNQYEFSRLRPARLPKENGDTRKLGIPTVRDRIVLQATRFLLEPRCEPRMASCSHAYRPQRGSHTALEAIRAAMTDGFQIVMETDIRKFFDSVPHASLKSKLAEMDPRCLDSRLIDGAITMSPGRWRAREGISQGSPLSPLLANVALTSFDHRVMKGDWTVVRYADDLAIFCRRLRVAEQAKRLVKRELDELGLKMHPDKTRIVDSRQSPFTFLGFEFHPDRLAPDAANVAKLRDAVAAWCNPHRKEPWELRIERINGLLRSFAWYYHQTDATSLFWRLDHDVQERLEELEATIGPASVCWRDRIVKMSRMRSVEFRTSKRQGGRRAGWDGYGS